MPRPSKPKLTIVGGGPGGAVMANYLGRFQSAQFREFEFLVGLKRSEMMKYCDSNSAGYRRLE